MDIDALFDCALETLTAKLNNISKKLYVIFVLNSAEMIFLLFGWFKFEFLSQTQFVLESPFLAKVAFILEFILPPQIYGVATLLAGIFLSILSRVLTDYAALRHKSVLTL